MKKHHLKDAAFHEIRSVFLVLSLNKPEKKEEIVEKNILSKVISPGKELHLLPVSSPQELTVRCKDPELQPSL